MFELMPRINCSRRQRAIIEGLLVAGFGLLLDPFTHKTLGWQPWSFWHLLAIAIVGLAAMGLSWNWSSRPEGEEKFSSDERADAFGYQWSREDGAAPRVSYRNQAAKAGPFASKPQQPRLKYHVNLRSGSSHEVPPLQNWRGQ